MHFRKITFLIQYGLLILGSVFALPSFSQVQNNLSLSASASASSQKKGFEASKAIDGMAGSWQNEARDTAAWLMVKLPGATEIFSIRLTTEKQPLSRFKIQTMLNGTWKNVKEIENNALNELEIVLKDPILSDRIRVLTENNEAVISELEMYGRQYVDSSASEVKQILVNQSGYNLHRPKRFTAAKMPDMTAFRLLRLADQKEVYAGVIHKGVGDFSDFNPPTAEEFVVVANGETSYPFQIGPNWIERVTYRNMVDFMAGARHYVGTTDKIRQLSWEWRDGDFFNWALQGMVALYLANPAAFENMEQTLHYIPNSSFPAPYKDLWGTLEPFHADTPDLIQLIHWDVDVKISQQLDHEMQKAELAHFLYAWPYLKKWLPQQNFELVYQYAKEIWEKSTVEPHSTSQYDLSPEHNLLALKTQLGTTKGELPPGHSVIPNLMMFEVAKRRGEEDADKYFQAAYRQMEWMIENLDWKDPMVTKGQRMSEHITMRSFAYFHHEYPSQAPKGLRQKVEDWARVAVSRSDNFWDFRKYSDEEWTPPSWNETGNVLGFPAACLAAMSVLEGSSLLQEMEILAWSHFDNAFGRNPVGRHFSYKGPDEIEGVDLGWFNRHQGGIGLLEEVRFVFDGSPKSFHYPNQPQVGNLGWTEGWVQFNTAFNISMAYLANYYTKISAVKTSGKHLNISLTAPINLSEDKKDSVVVRMTNSKGEDMAVHVTEASPFSTLLEGKVKIRKNSLQIAGQTLPVEKGENIHISYGYGYFKKEIWFRF